MPIQLTDFFGGGQTTQQYATLACSVSDCVTAGTDLHGAQLRVIEFPLLKLGIGLCVPTNGFTSKAGCS